MVMCCADLWRPWATGRRRGGWHSIGWGWLHCCCPAAAARKGACPPAPDQSSPTAVFILSPSKRQPAVERCLNCLLLRPLPLNRSAACLWCPAQLAFASYHSPYLTTAANPSSPSTGVRRARGARHQRCPGVGRAGQGLCAGGGIPGYPEGALRRRRARHARRAQRWVVGMGWVGVVLSGWLDAWPVDTAPLAGWMGRRRVGNDCTARLLSPVLAAFWYMGG